MEDVYIEIGDGGNKQLLEWNKDMDDFFVEFQIFGEGKIMKIRFFVVIDDLGY